MGAYRFNLPDIGEGLSEGEIVRWHAELGAPVTADAVLVEVETDKAVVEIPHRSAASSPSSAVTQATSCRSATCSR